MTETNWIVVDHSCPQLEDASSPWAWFKVMIHLGFGWDMVVGVTARLDDELRLQEPFASRIFGMEKPTLPEIVGQLGTRCLDREMTSEQVRETIRFYVHAPEGMAWKVQMPTRVKYEEWLELLQDELRRQWVTVTGQMAKQLPGMKEKQ